jgi:hypothetical protein
MQILKDCGPPREEGNMASLEGVAARVERGECEVECQAPIGQGCEVAKVVTRESWPLVVVPTEDCESGNERVQGEDGA